MRCTYWQPKYKFLNQSHYKSLPEHILLAYTKRQIPSLKELKQTLGSDYTIRVIDWEKCLYRDFGNGFNVEVNGCSRANHKGCATLYLWFGEHIYDCLIVKTVHDVGRSAEEIHDTVENLYAYSRWLIDHGYDSRDKLYELKIQG